MAARLHERPVPGNPAHWAHLTAGSPERDARHAPTRLDEATPTGFFGRFLAQLAAPNTQLAIHPAADGQDVRHLLDVTTGPAATLTATGDGGHTVRQTGPRRLWDDIETAWDTWDHAGRPGPETFRMRIDHDRQTITNPQRPNLTFTLS
ncbi:hypothetical protein AB0J52_06760 [Spirillospora sp. NPDC049652]